MVIGKGFNEEKNNRNNLRDRVMVPYVPKYSILPSKKYEPGYKTKDSLKMLHILPYKNSYSWLVSENLSLLFQLFFLSHH